MGNDVQHRWDPSPSSRTGDFGVLGGYSDRMDALLFLEILFLLRISENDIHSVLFPSAFSISCLQVYSCFILNFSSVGLCATSQVFKNSMRKGEMSERWKRLLEQVE